MRRGTLRVVMAMLSACALAACTSNPADPPTTPPATSAAPSPTATPSPTPTPDAATPPERPDMSRIDAETAEAVATYFLELYPYVYATGDLSEWRALSHPDCIFCESVIADVEAISAKGHRAEGGSISADIAAAEVSSGYFAVQGTATQAAGAEYEASGARVDESDGGDFELAIVVLAEGGWAVRAVEFRATQG